VVGLSYLIADDGTEATYAALKLQFSDPASPAAGGHIYARLPPPFVGGADFLVPRSRFDAAVARMWSIDDHCQVGASHLLPARTFCERPRSGTVANSIYGTNAPCPRM
jgi:hypothetical protein